MSNYSSRRKDNRGKDRDRDNYHHSRRDKSSRDNSSRDSYRKTNQNHNYNDSYQQEESTELKPTKTIIMKGLLPQTTEDIILDYLKPFGRVESLKLVVDKVTSISKGIAYIEFPTIEDAEYFMLKNYVNSGFYLEIEGYYVELDYVRGDIASTKTPVYRDWRCPACNGTNFARRSVCYQCQAPKPENAESCIISVDDSKDSEELPCSVLSIRGLSGQTTKQTLLEIFQGITTVKDVRVVWDKFRNESKGFGFIEFYSTEDATYALNQCNGLIVDDHHVKISFCKSGGLKKTSHPPPTTMNPYEQWGQYPVNIQMNATSMVNTAQAQANAFLASFTDPAKPVLGIPNEEEYSYDATSGYYYNPNNQLYYDANTGYFYDSVKQQYCYYNAETNSFLPYTAPLDTQTSSTPSTTSSDDANAIAQEKKKKKAAANLIGAKKLSQEIGKWNAKSKELKEGEVKLVKKSVSKTVIIKKPISDIQPISEVQQEAPNPSEQTAPIIDNNTVINTPPTVDPTPAATEKTKPEESKISFSFTNTTSHTVQSTPINNNNNTEKQTTEEDSVCLLCKRKFPSNEALLKHKQLSELHKHNLELAKIKEELRQKEKKNEQERRNRELQDIADSLKNYSASISDEPRSDLGQNNVGSKLLKKMGWQEGGGLGKSKSGITAPIQVELRTERAGLGSESSYDKELNLKPTDNYREVAKKKARARFAAMMENPDSKRIKRD